jgi:RHS repeat-associated protein
VAGVPAYPSGVGVCVTRYQYDAGGRHTRTVLPTSNGTDNRFVAYAYTDDNLLASVDAPSPAQPTGARTTAATYLYDGTGKQLRTTDALGNQTTTAYTADGLVTQQVAQPNGSITHVTSHAYDANGEQTSTTDALNHRSTTTYYADGQTSSLVDPLSDTTKYVYDPVGNLTQTFSPSAVAKDATNTAGTPSTVTYTFDNLPLTSTSPVAPDGSSLRRTTYGYDAAGRKTSQALALVDAQGNVTSPGGSQGFTYLHDDRMATETGRNGETITHAYDPAGGQTSVRDGTSGGSAITATYYLDGLPRTVDDGSRSSLYTYDGAGQRTAMADQIDGSANRATTTYTYGDAGQAVSMSSTLVGGGQTSWTYDAAGRLQQESDPNGQRTSLTFNPDDTLATKNLTNSSGSVASFSYQYDGNLQIASQTFTGQGNKQGKQTYTYDPAGRLLTFTQGSSPTQTATWDHDGNRLTFGGNGSSSYNADNSLASSTDQSGTAHPQRYSARGDLANDGCFTYTYDGFDRMTTVTPTGVSTCPPTPATSYTYDGLGRQRTAGSTTLRYDGFSSLVSVETKAGTDTAYELDPGGLAKAVAVQAPAAGTPQYLSDDGQGNITTITNASAGLDCSVRYDPWGSPVGAQSAQNPCDAGSTINDHFYRGQRVDPVTGSYQLGDRTYSPSKASFINPDTYRSAPPQQDLGVTADPLTENRYAYVNGDPVNLDDPSGHCSINPFSWGDCAAKAASWVNQNVIQPAWSWTDQNVIQPVANWTNQNIVQPVVNNVVKPVAHAVSSTVHAVTQGVTKAWNATVNCFAGPGHTCLKVGAVVLGAAALGTACALTVGLACLAAAGIGAAIGAGVGAATCGSGQSLAGCIATGAVVGGIGGLAFPVAGAALGAAGIGGLGATLLAGGASGLAGGLASQTLAGHYDIGQLALDTVAGAATAGLAKGAGSVLSRAFPGLRGAGGTLGRMFLGDTASDDAATLKAAVNERYNAITGPGGQSPRLRGPVLSGVMDRQTGGIFFGQNTGIPADLHPILQARIGDVQAVPFKGVPGSHSEVNAANAALWARPGATMQDLLIYSLRLRGSTQGQPILRCGACAALTAGATEAR